MENIKLWLDEIESESEKSNLAQKLPFLLEEINKVFLVIKSCEDVHCASKYFKLLDLIHLCVARLMFVKHIEVTDEFWKFFKDFDRIDDAGEREYLFNLIKSGEYSLSDSHNIFH